MGNIIQLDETLSNMIAAGEVVENMASVIKELTENAIDAKSHSVEIHLQQSGLKSMRVVDDGVGMDQNDLSMAFKRHATSKIKTHHDLYHIASLGFRGEALPSIASVSTLSIVSSVNGQSAHEIIYKAGRLVKEKKCARPQGTTVTVQNLFYNTPARLKHLKSEPKELSYIVEYINKMALSHPAIKFTLTNDGRTLFKTTGDGDLLKILHQIYSLDIIKNMVSFENKNQYFHIKGYLTKPGFNRSSRQHMSIITNHRIIKNTKLLKAIQEGYNTYLPQHKYPIVFLDIEVDPLLIDVNIHPQKLEVKFTEQASLERLIKDTINKTLTQENLIPEVKKEKTSPIIQERMVLNEQSENQFSDDDAIETYHHQIREASSNRLNDTKPKHSPLDFGQEHKIDAIPKAYDRFPELDYIGQYLGTYLLFQSYDGLYLIDQHAAAERVRYERYYKAMSEDNFSRHPLMVPFTLHLSNNEIINIKAQHDELEALGLTVKPKTDSTLEIHTIPDWFMKGDEEDYAERMVKHMLKDQDLSIGVIIDQLAKDLSCKHSIRANKYINKDEINILIRDLERANNPFTCPHGRPTLIKFSKQEIEKMFKRVQP